MDGSLLSVLSNIDKQYRDETFETHCELDKDIRNLRILMLVETRLLFRGKMRIVVCVFVEASYELIMTLLIHTNSKIIILNRQIFLDNKIFSLMSDQLRHIFDGIYQIQGFWTGQVRFYICGGYCCNIVGYYSEPRGNGGVLKKLWQAPSLHHFNICPVTHHSQDL